MRVVNNASEFEGRLEEARKEAGAAFGNDAVFLERYVRRARHVEVQILGDEHGNLIHLHERDCSVQRRHQKVVEVAPAVGLAPEVREGLANAALLLAKTAGYRNAGTVEFLVDIDTNEFFFIEVNPRIQVEHTVTEMVTGIDLVRAQILIAQGCRLNEAPLALPKQVPLNGFALQCRITTEDPRANFAPDYGRINTYRSPGGFGIRLDGGSGYGGAIVTPFYDSLLVKVTATGTDFPQACQRMERALREFRIRGVKTNIPFLENVVNHPEFQAGEITTSFLDTNPDLFAYAPRRDRATKLLSYLGEVIINGNPEVAGKPKPMRFPEARSPPGSRANRLKELATSSNRKAPKASQDGPPRSNAFFSQTPPSATPTNRCLPPACAPSTCCASRISSLTTYRAFTVSKCGAAPPSMWPCASSSKIPGNACKSFAPPSQTSASRCSSAPQTQWDTPRIPIT